MLDAKTLAASLINTRSQPPGLRRIIDQAAEARAYHVLEPYPLYWFRDWKTEDRGPLPRCMPLARSIVNRGARWLFGKPWQILCPANTVLETEIRKAWAANKMDSRLVAMASKGAQESGLVLKFGYDETADPKISFQSLSITNEVRLFYHPHNRDQLLMARIQYSYFDASVGKTFWYREEWTAEEEVHYIPVPDEALTTNRMWIDPDVYEGWEIDPEATKPNPFRLIPLVHVKNLETDDTWGRGDLWDLYRVLDRIHLTYHLMDKSNQFDSSLNPFFVDLDVDDQDIDKPLQPGQPVDLKTDDNAAPQGKQGHVQFPPSGNSLRPAMMEYTKDLRKQILDAASSVMVDQAEFTNKGNLTSSVLQQLYLPQIEITEEKYKSYGIDGLVPFIALVAKGLQRIGVQMGVNEDDEETYTVTFRRPPYFEPSADEKAATVGRIQEEEIAGYTTHDRAVEAVALMEGVTDVEALKVEIAKEPRPTAVATDPNAEPPVLDAPVVKMEQMVQGLTRIAGKGGL